MWNYSRASRESYITERRQRIVSERAMTAASPTLSDDELLRRIIAGDEEAFAALYRRRGAAVYRFALHMCGSETIAEDVTQEVFMVLMCDAGKFDSSRGSLAAYLYGIARNHVLRSLARDRSYVPIMDDETEEGSERLTPQRFVANEDPLGDLTRSEMIERVRHAVLALPSHYREVVVLCELHEMNYRDAADVLGCAVGTIRSRLHRARLMLVERLRADEQSETNSRSVNSTRCFA